MPSKAEATATIHSRVEEHVLPHDSTQCGDAPRRVWEQTSSRVRQRLRTKTQPQGDITKLKAGAAPTQGNHTHSESASRPRAAPVPGAWSSYQMPQTDSKDQQRCWILPSSCFDQ